MARPNPLANSRFRAALLIGAGVPIAALYLWRTVAQPLLLGTVPGDFGENYLAAGLGERRPLVGRHRTRCRGRDQAPAGPAGAPPDLGQALAHARRSRSRGNRPLAGGGTSIPA